MLNSLNWFAAGASDLFWRVLCVEALGVRSYEGVSCGKSVESGLSGARALSLFVEVSWFPLASQAENGECVAVRGLEEGGSVYEGVTRQFMPAFGPFFNCFALFFFFFFLESIVF